MLLQSRQSGYFRIIHNEERVKPMKKISDLSAKEVMITGGFWKVLFDKVKSQVIPYQWKVLNDAIF